MQSRITAFARKGPFSRRVKQLKQAADSGSARATFELGCLLEEGVVDGHGRQVVAPALVKAVAAYRCAAALGDPGAWLNLGLCYDYGKGVRRSQRRALLCYLDLWKAKRDPSAANNAATVYRDYGDSRAAFRWWRKAAEAGDRTALVDVGYCLYNGIGVRRDEAEALDAFRRASRSTYISAFELEEALYHRAVVHLDRGGAANRTKARLLLMRANRDDDFEQARELLAQLSSARRPIPCRCRRGWRRSIKGQAPCALHRSG
jgi:TPR repeat protein